MSSFSDALLYATGNIQKLYVINNYNNVRTKESIQSLFGRRLERLVVHDSCFHTWVSFPVVKVLTHMLS